MAATTQSETRNPDKATTSRIPTFATIEEEAEFWDTHDMTDFDDEFEDVTDVRFVRVADKDSVIVQFDEPTLAALKERAFAQEIGVSSLVRRWVMERLRSPAPDS